MIADDGSKTWQCSDSDYCNAQLALRTAQIEVTA
jgi:alpha-D-ribose 1-methylphosphonate 5-phosphate C-P lyase